jgi:hypothetical protein
MPVCFPSITLHLSQNNCDVIARYPINDSLEHLQHLFEEAEEAYDASADPREEICLRAITRLLYALQGVEAAFNLRSQRSDQDAASDLANSEVLLSGLFRRLRQGDFNYEHYRALVIEEIRNSTFQDVGGFFSKYFEGKDWSEATEAIYRDVQSADVDGKWTEFPDPPHTE